MEHSENIEGIQLLGHCEGSFTSSFSTTMGNGMMNKDAGRYF